MGHRYDISDPILRQLAELGQQKPVPVTGPRPHMHTLRAKLYLVRKLMRSESPDGGQFEITWKLLPDGQVTITIQPTGTTLRQFLPTDLLSEIAAQPAATLPADFPETSETPAPTESTPTPDYSPFLSRLGVGG